MRYFLFLFGLTFLALRQACMADAPPNILLIVSEDNGPELGCYGDTSARTPHLDKLASEGVLFNAHRSTSRMQSVTGEFFNGSLPSPTWPDWIGHLGF